MLKVAKRNSFTKTENKLADNDKNNSRPSWDDYFLEIADSVSKRATCDRGKSGCVIVKDKQILVTGFVGSPVGFAHCDDVGHLMEDGHCVRTVHAEANALVQAAHPVHDVGAHERGGPVAALSQDLRQGDFG